MLPTSGQRKAWNLGIAIGLGISGAIVMGSDRAIAQIQADPTVETLVNGSPSLLCTPNCTITGGTQAGTNLFHSFSQFSVPNGGEAFFNTNNAPIQNIISRVTGSSISTIDGTLRANGTANLFLINPNGISFGANAKLNLGGSFVASTANSVNFADGTQFSTTPSQSPPLLTVSVPLGVQYGGNNGNISVIGAGSPSVSQGFGLKVQPGRTLALLGGNVTLNGGIVQAPGGRIELGGLTEAGTVGLTFDGNNNPRFTFPDGVVRGDVLLNTKAVVDVTGVNGGDIFINARNLQLLDDSNFCAGIGSNIDCGGTPGQAIGSSSSQAGNIVVDATQEVRLSQSSRIANNINENATGNSADIFAAIRNETLFGSVVIRTGSLFLTEGSSLSTSTFGNGNAGIVYVQARDLVSISGFQIDPATQERERSRIASVVLDSATGNAGGTLIETGTLSLTNFGWINSSTYGQGTAGDVVVQARGDVTFDNSDIFSNVESGGVGNAGQINIEAESLSVINGSQLQSGVRGPAKDGNPGAGQGNGGNVTINVRDRVTVGGLNSDGFPGAIFTDVESGATGNAGNINITARSVEVFNRGRMNTSISGNGKAGSVFVRATDSVSVTGTGTLGPCSTGICSTIDEGAVVPPSSGNTFAGNAFDILAGASDTEIVGSVVIITGTLSLTDGAVINTSTYGQGNAGAVVVLADDEVSINNNSAIGSLVGTTGVGSAGGVILRAGSISIANTSGLTTSTFGQGDAGLILVLTDGDISMTNGGGILSTVEPGSTFKAGGIGIRARTIRLKDGSSISVNNEGSGEAGSMLIQARDLFVLDSSFVSAVTLSGQGGDIELQLDDFLALRRGSDISTTAGFAPGGGDGGNMRIQVGYIFGLPVNDNNITAQAYEGKGGSIRIRSNRLYAIDRRDDDFLDTNDITVSSTYGRDGELELNNVDIDPTQGLTSLTEAVIDPSTLIAPRCAIRGKDSDEEVNKFTITGRGGIPPSPNDTLQNDSVETNWVTTDPPRQNRTEDDSSTNLEQSVPSATRVPKTPALVEAQGWVYGSNGEVILTAHAPTVTPQHPSLIPATSCNGY